MLPLIKSDSVQQADQMAKLTVTLETEPGLTMSEYWSPLQVRQRFGSLQVVLGVDLCRCCWGRNTPRLLRYDDGLHDGLHDRKLIHHEIGMGKDFTVKRS